MNEILMVGSIVKLKENDLFKYMIVGYHMIDNDTGIRYDYAAVEYPHGIEQRPELTLFNQEDIEDIHYRCAATEAEKNLISSLMKA